jgi:predicted nucleic acid-binding protein
VLTAVLDTNVLYPSLQRDFLLSMAAEGLYQPRWSEAILEELRRHEARKRVKQGTDRVEAGRRADFLVERMRVYFTDALVEGWEHLDGTFGLPDSDDEHVVAAAVVGGANVIVTENIKHFPAERLRRQVEALHAKEFATDAVDVDPDRAVAAVRVLAARFKNPPTTPEAVVEDLVRRYDMVEVGEILGPLLAGG